MSKETIDRAIDGACTVLIVLFKVSVAVVAVLWLGGVL